MMLLWACAGVPLGAYNILSDFNIALIVQPQILTVLSLITWGQCFYYDDVRFPFLFRDFPQAIFPGSALTNETEMEHNEVLLSAHSYKCFIRWN